MADPTGKDQRMARPVAVITGAAGGIGLAVTRRLARTHRVALLDIDADAVRQAARDLGGTALALRCDITDPESVEAAVRAVVEQFGAIDVAVSNAGIGPVGTVRHLDPSVLATVLDVNVTGNWRFIRECLPHLIASRGYVLGVASAASIFAPPGEGMYAASKAGLEALLDVFRVEVAHLGVGVGVAYPMFIDTPMVRDADHEHADFARTRARLPGAAGKTFPVSLAADRIVRGIQRRQRRVFIPGSLRLQYLLRGFLSALLDRKLQPIAVEVDQLTEQKVAGRGAVAGGWSEAVLRSQKSQPGGD
ncbi:SDR family NAD(P)-dependent oxidoreductase [Streptomyces sp. NPDC013157]|uniref:SDR family NAD(P)-dependent oxidoreductase n=1 Tax=Streptomyces sp. NPDC013157 TaxID=3364861 RepID=UPI00369D69E7